MRQTLGQTSQKDITTESAPRGLLPGLDWWEDREVAIWRALGSLRRWIVHQRARTRATVSNCRAGNSRLWPVLWRHWQIQHHQTVGSEGSSWRIM